MAMPLTHYRFTVDEYHRMAEAGILHEDDRVELLDGQIVPMTPIGRRHAACVTRLTHLFAPLTGGRVTLRIQGPLIVGEHQGPSRMWPWSPTERTATKRGIPAPPTRCWSSRSPIPHWKRIGRRRSRCTHGPGSPRLGS